MSRTPKDELLIKRRKRPKRSPIEIEATEISLAFGSAIFVPAEWKSERLILSAAEFRTQIVETMSGEPSEAQLKAGLIELYEAVSKHESASELSGDFMLPFIIDHCEKRYVEEGAKPQELARICGILACRCLDRFVDRMYDVFNKRYEASTATELEAIAADYLAEGWAALGYAVELQNKPLLSSDQAKKLAKAKHRNNNLLKEYILPWYRKGKRNGEYKNAHHASSQLSLTAFRKSEKIWEEAGNQGWKPKSRDRLQRSIYDWFRDDDAELAAK